MKTVPRCRLTAGSPVLVAVCALAHAAFAQDAAPRDAAGQRWRPAGNRIMTRWAQEVSPSNALPDYPRPQLVRDDWLNLNGLWDYAVQPREAKGLAQPDGTILVPFAIGSALSGVERLVEESERLWYRRTFELPGAWPAKRVLLHFGAVDWEATVWVDGEEVGVHRGGYDPFTFDITDALAEKTEHELVVAVCDPTDARSQPRGKQTRRPEGIFYTRVTGIWQTVWLEPVPEVFVDSLYIVPDVDAGLVRVTVHALNARGTEQAHVAVLDGDAEVASAGGPVGQPVAVRVADAKLWSPDSPFLYGLRVELRRDGDALDRVTSYFGMRSISTGKDAKGATRLLLNGKPLFQLGLLDQGYWPDGLYTAPTDEALRYDIEVTKKLGFNMARKHVKVEPDRWYYWCDRLGLLVWQDMPSGSNDGEEARAQFELELDRMVGALHNHPSIVMWVPFNEGWGQHDTARIARRIAERDPSRLVNNASGGVDAGAGHVCDIHAYPGPAIPPHEPARALVLGEFGGLGYVVADHRWQEEGGWGYRSYDTQQALTDAYVALIEKLVPLARQGLAAAVYTQTTDVETEVNGVMSYDRAIIKMDADRVTKANASIPVDAGEQPKPIQQ